MVTPATSCLAINWRFFLRLYYRPPSGRVTIAGTRLANIFVIPCRDEPILQLPITIQKLLLINTGDMTFPAYIEAADWHFLCHFTTRIFSTYLTTFYILYRNGPDYIFTMASNCRIWWSNLTFRFEIHPPGCITCFLFDKGDDPSSLRLYGLLSTDFVSQLNISSLILSNNFYCR